MKIQIEYADMNDLEFFILHDRHINKDMVEKKLKHKEIIKVSYDIKLIGWLRYGYFWDNIPFMNMLYFDEEYRGKGYGTKLVYYWEKEMKGRGYGKVMTSTLSNEQAQQFYRKHGYKDAGCLLLENETLEILFVKSI